MFFEIGENEQVWKLVDKIFDKSGLNPEVQRLFFAGKIFNFYRFLADYNIIENSTVNMILRIKGTPDPLRRPRRSRELILF